MLSFTTVWKCPCPCKKILSNNFQLIFKAMPTKEYKGPFYATVTVPKASPETPSTVVFA